jgi:hypothetical protein
MTKSLTRALRRRAWNESNGYAEGSRVSIPNLYGNPIGKPICVRSIRRANRRWLKLWRGQPAADTPATVYAKNSSCHATRCARMLKRNIRFLGVD